MTAFGLVAAEAGAPNILDESHLGRMTLGDRRLEREILEIFVRQSTVMLGRVAEGGAGLAVAAHTLKGSARGVGAWRVAGAAERLERACEQDGEASLDAAIDDLRAATVEVNAAIGQRLGEAADPL
jgi:HPt (histidine-containing phosphotransfer) domain-containing protein